MTTRKKAKEPILDLGKPENNSKSGCLLVLGSYVLLLVLSTILEPLIQDSSLTLLLIFMGIHFLLFIFVVIEAIRGMEFVGARGTWLIISYFLPLGGILYIWYGRSGRKRIKNDRDRERHNKWAKGIAFLSVIFLLLGVLFTYISPSGSSLSLTVLGLLGLIQAILWYK